MANSNIKVANKQEIDKVNKHLQLLRNQMYKIEVEVLDGGKLPFKAHKTDAGFDLFATDDVTLYPGQIIKHPLNIKMKLPTGSWARIETKSGLGSKGMLVYAGVVDQEYRGIPHVIATNLNPPVIEDPVNGGIILNVLEPIVVKKGEKLAQMTMNPHSNEYFIEQVESVDTNTVRGEGGFGSTGKV